MDGGMKLEKKDDFSGADMNALINFEQHTAEQSGSESTGLA